MTEPKVGLPGSRRPFRIALSWAEMARPLFSSTDQSLTVAQPRKGVTSGHEASWPPSRSQRGSG